MSQNIDTPLRRLRTSRLLLLSLAVASIASTPAAAEETDPFEVGRPFPDLALPAAEDGRKLSIRDFRGEKLILHVFASW